MVLGDRCSLYPASSRHSTRPPVFCLGSSFLLVRSADGRAAFRTCRDPQLRRRLNAATHLPIAVGILWRVFLAWLSLKSFVVIDMPLLFETRSHRYCNETVLVTAPDSLQLERLCARDGLSREEAIARIRSQMPQQDKARLATLVIANDGEYRHPFTPMS